MGKMNELSLKKVVNIQAAIKCEARQWSDQMQCDKCGLLWDMNDQDPPQCGKEYAKQSLKHLHKSSESKNEVIKFSPFT